LDAIYFLPQMPYLVPGTLRELLLRTGQEKHTSDERILQAIHEGRLDSIVARVGGLDVEHDWPTVLSLGEQQQLVLIRLILAQPKFAFLDRIGTALGQDQLRQTLQRLAEHSITYITFEDSTDIRKLHDAMLLCDLDGTWRFS
jgi:putative ATP-binding cassette transporter